MGAPLRTSHWEQHCKMLGKYVFSEFLRCFLDFWLFSAIFGYFCICHTFLDFPWEISFCRDFRSFPEFRENLRKSAKNTRNNTKIPEKYENTRKIPQTIRKYPKKYENTRKIPQTIRKYPKNTKILRIMRKHPKIHKKYPQNTRNNTNQGRQPTEAVHKILHGGWRLARACKKIGEQIPGQI